MTHDHSHLPEPFQAWVKEHYPEWTIKRTKESPTKIEGEDAYKVGALTLWRVNLPGEVAYYASKEDWRLANLYWMDGTLLRPLQWKP